MTKTTHHKLILWLPLLFMAFYTSFQINKIHTTTTQTDYNSMSIGVSATHSTSPDKAKDNGVKPNIGLPQDVDKQSITHTAINENTTINITDTKNQTQDTSKISTDTDNASFTMTQINTEVLDIRADISQELSEDGFKAVGDYAMELAAKGDESWEDGGISKTLAHAAMGAVVAGIGNGDAIGGALGAGAAEMARPATEEESDSTQQWVSTLVGAVAGGGTGASTGLDGEKFNRQLHQQEIAWIEANAEAFAIGLYGANPSPEQLADAKARLAQQALRGVDKGWSLKLGSEADENAKAFLEQNNANLFTVKDEYEFRDGSTDGKSEISDLSQSQFDNLSNFYQVNINRATTTNQQGSLRNGLEALGQEREQAMDALGDITASDVLNGIMGLPEAIVEDIKNIPNTIESAGNSIDAMLPTENHDRLNELYGSETDGATLQRELGAGDVLGTIGMATGAGAVVRGTVGGVVRSLDGAVDDALDINLERTTINDNPFDSRPISNEDATKLLEERYMAQGVSPDDATRYAQETVDSFEGQITTRMVLDGDNFVVNHTDGEAPSGRYVVRQEDANTLPTDTRRDLALPNSNQANTQTEITVTRPHDVLEGTVADQSHNSRYFPPTATGGGQQTFVDPDLTNKNEIFGD